MASAALRRVWVHTLLTPLTPLTSTAGAFLDVFYELQLKHTGDEKRSKKILKDMIKVAVKVGLLYRHNQFSEPELGTLMFPSSFLVTHPLVAVVLCCNESFWARQQQPLRILLANNWTHETPLWAGVGTKFRSKLKMAILTMISYHDVQFSFDAEFLMDVLQECQVRPARNAHSPTLADTPLPCPSTDAAEKADLGTPDAQIARSGGQRVCRALRR